MSRKLHIHAPAIHYFDMVRRCFDPRSRATPERRLVGGEPAILKLEDEIGAPLFDRLPGGLRLTGAGEIFARHVTVVLQDMGACVPNWTLQGLRTGHVEIATIEAVTSDLLPCVLKAMRERYPDITVGVTLLGSQAIPEAVSSGAVDLGLAFALPRSVDLHNGQRRPFPPRCHRLPAAPVGATPGHRLRRLRRTWPDHGQERAVHPSPAGAAPAPFARTAPGGAGGSSLELSRQLARRGLGVAFQTRLGIEADIAQGELRFLPLKDNGGIHSDLGLCVRTGRYLPVAVDALARQIAEEVRLREREEARLNGPERRSRRCQTACPSLLVR